MGLKQSPEAVEERRRKALALHSAGATYQQIADVVGFATSSGAHACVREALKAHRPDSMEEEWESQLARSDAMLQGLWPAARKGDAQAVEKVLKLEERRVRVLTALGLYTPPQEEAEETQEKAPERAPQNALSDFERKLREREQQPKSQGGS